MRPVWTSRRSVALAQTETRPAQGPIDAWPPDMNALTAMIVASTVASALVGGVFLAFSVFVMRALADLPAAQDVLAMHVWNHVRCTGYHLAAFQQKACRTWWSTRRLREGYTIPAIRASGGAVQPSWRTGNEGLFRMGTHCSQMRSCAEATCFLRHCPDTRMDGDDDGVPCERQWCE